MNTIHLNWHTPDRLVASETYYCNTPIGSLSIQMQASLLGKIEWLNDKVCQPSVDIPRQLEQILNHYWRTAKADYTLPLLEQGTAFQQKVWLALCSIPPGQTKTYGELAQTLNTSPRALANACRSNPFPIIIPCHRVLAKTGLGGYAGQTSGAMLTIKQALLRFEKTLMHER